MTCPNHTAPTWGCHLCQPTQIFYEPPGMVIDSKSALQAECDQLRAQLAEEQMKRLLAEGLHNSAIRTIGTAAEACNKMEAERDAMRALVAELDGFIEDHHGDHPIPVDADSCRGLKRCDCGYPEMRQRARTALAGSKP